MCSSVAATTASAYKVGWNKWLSFATLVARPPFPTAHDAGIRVGDIILPCMVALTVAFCAFSFKEVGLSASSISGHLAGVAFNLKLANFDTDFLTAPAVQMVKAGMKRLSVSAETKSKGALPFTLDMILAYSRFVDLPGSTLESLGILVAMHLAFACLLRRSEYIPTPADHFIRAKDVSFILFDGSTIGSHSLTAALALLVSQIVISIPSSKRDQERKGFSFVFSRNHPPSKVLCDIIIRWCCSVHLYPDDPFLSARNNAGIRVWCINPTPLTAALQAVARSLGFSVDQIKRFTPHALRYGGASTLAAAGVDRYQIQLAGRWKSDTFMTYLLASHSVFERTNSALANPSWLTATSIRQLL